LAGTFEGHLPQPPLGAGLKPTLGNTSSSEEAVLSVTVGGRDSRMPGAKPGLVCTWYSLQAPSFPCQKSAKENMN